jgi:hypothetical protein
MTLGQAIVSIILALIAGVSGTITFFVKRKDEKEEKNINKIVDDAVIATKAEIYKELAKVSQERSDEGAERFRIHAESFKEVNRQIKENTEQIGELTEISKNVLETIGDLNTTVLASAESQRNAIYDRILIVGKKVLSEGKITLSDKTNVKQLYDSYRKLKGNDPYIDTLYDECSKLPLVAD